MAELKFANNTSIAEIAKKIAAAEGEEITLTLESGSPILNNPLNFKILEKIAAENGKQLQLTEIGPSGQMTEIKEDEITENLGFVEEGSDPEVVQEAETLQEAASSQAPTPTESETLTLTPEPASPAMVEPKFGIETDQPLLIGEQPLAASVPAENSGPKSSFLPIKGFKLPPINLQTLKHLNRRQLLIGGGILGFVLIFFGLFYVLPSAEVTLYVASQNLEKQATVTATPRLSEIDIPSSSIPLTTVEAKESGSLSTKVFGKKNVGDSAKGKVTVRNYSTSAEKSLPKGAVMKVVGKSPVLEFSLDRAVTVPTATASASVDALGRIVEVTDPGRLDVEATAVKIGTDGNITNGTRMAVNNESLTLVDAVAASDFSGGTSREVTVVSLNDRSNLLATLSAQLTEKAKETIKGKLTEGQKLPDGGVETSEVKKIFSKDIDQEATDLNLNLEINAKANVYNEKDLATLLSESIKADVPSGFKVSEDNSEATAEVLKVNDDKTITLLSKFKGKLIPDLDTSLVAQNLKGKGIDAAKEYLESLNNIDDMEIKLQPQLLSFLKSFPQSSKRIKISIVTKD